MKVSKIMVALALTVVTAAPIALAGDKHKKSGTHGVDTNGDGVISRSEWTHDVAKFDRLDTNGDGVLSSSERATTYKAKSERTTYKSKTKKVRHHGMDKNRDGVVTRGEWRGNDQSFRQHDSNGDGVLSGAEVRTGKKKM